MKTFFKIFAVISFVVFLGWAYLIYLYLHEENKTSLDKIKSDLDKAAKKVVKEVDGQKSQLFKEIAEQNAEIAGVVANRQNEIRKAIQELKKDGFELKDIAQSFKNISERTLRRDLKKLEEMGILAKEGSTKDSKYRKI